MPGHFPDSVPLNHQSKIEDSERLSLLRTLGVLDTLPEESFDRFVRLAVAAIGMPVGLVSFVDKDRQFFKAQHGLPDDVAKAQQTPLSHSFCQYVVSSGTSLRVDDAREHSLLAGNGAVADLGVVAYLGIPVHAPGGEVLGSFCAIDSNARNWTKREEDILKDIAALVENEILLRHEVAMRKVLARELNHRVKNLFAMVSGMIQMTARSAANPKAMAKSLTERVGALLRAHDLISPAVSDDTADQLEVSLSEIVATAVMPHVLGRMDAVRAEGPLVVFPPKSAINFALLLHELVTNAAKYGALSIETGKVAVQWWCRDGKLFFEWRETGGPKVTGASERKGFGSKLIEMTLKVESGIIETVWKPEGVHHNISLPVPIVSS